MFGCILYNIICEFDEPQIILLGAISGLYQQFSEPVALGGDKKDPWADKKKLPSNVIIYTISILF